MMNINDVESEELPEKLSENLPENAKQRQSRGPSAPGPRKELCRARTEGFCIA
jgi:hypothetical protein